MTYAEKNALEFGSCVANYLADASIKPIEHVVVIPAYKESSDFISRFISSSIVEQPVLCIVVINQPECDVDKRPQQALLNAIRTSGTSLFRKEGIELITINNHSYCLVVDAFTQSLPVDQGVGLARKIGSDIALFLINENLIQSDWIHSTDADAHLPENYFEATRTLHLAKNYKSIVAVSYNFTHEINDKAIYNANKLYETALRYYVAGLTYAKSTYNFFTIGSVIAFKAKEYATVRGFPKRSAGEDFYLLNKLAKLGRVDFLKDIVVTIDARVSDRVPFGTGPSVAAILQLKAENKAYCYYHPQVFEELKACISHFNSLWESRLNIETWLSLLSEESQKALLETKLDTFVGKQKNNNELQFNKQLNVWFDAFKTLKFIHSLRDQKYADISLMEAIELAEFSVEHK
jgi:hypothetical protein